MKAHKIQQLLVIVFVLSFSFRNAWAQNPHDPAFTATLEACAARLSTSMNFATQVDGAATPGVIPLNVPGNPIYDVADQCNDFSFVLVRGQYDTLGVAVSYSGPNIAEPPSLPGNAPGDCGHSTVIYGIFNQGPTGAYSIVPDATSEGWGHFDAGQNKCLHDWTGSPLNTGAQSYALTNANNAILAVQSWQHNSVPFGHSGTYCANNGVATGDPFASCLFPTHVTLVRNGFHPLPPPTGPGIANDKGIPSGYPGVALPFDQYSSRGFPSGNWDTSKIFLPRSFQVADDGWFFAAECSAHAGGMIPFSHDYVIGISSRGSPSRAHSALCRSTEHNIHGAPSSFHYLSRGGNDPATPSYQWDTGAVVMAECGYHEVITGVAQTEANEIDAIACTQSDDVHTGISPSSCTLMKFANSTNNCPDGCAGNNDWAVGYVKNQCPSTQYMRGVAKRMKYLPPLGSGPSGEIDAILCCNW
jgi:hypothetical protein